MTRTHWIGLLAVAVAAGCGDDSDRSPPPIDTGPPMTGQTAGATSTSTGTGTDTDVSSSSSSSSEGSTEIGEFTVITGSLHDGGGGYALPITCSVRFHVPGTIEPSTGVDTAFAFARPVTVDEFPQSFSISSVEAGGVVSPGDNGFITVVCDVDGDGLNDDSAGGYFPSLPLAEITVPASEVAIAVGSL